MAAVLSAPWEVEKVSTLHRIREMDYLLPTATDIPDDIVPVVIESRGGGDGPYGAKGIGEPPIVGVSPAVANAIEDAVSVRIRDLPITPERVARALNPIGQGDSG